MQCVRKDCGCLVVVAQIDMGYYVLAWASGPEFQYQWQLAFISYNIKRAFVCERSVGHRETLCWGGVYKLGHFVRQNYWVVLIPASPQGSITMLFDH